MNIALVLLSIAFQLISSEEISQAKTHQGNILIPMTLGGSQTLNQKELARYLSQSHYNVTVICPYDMEIEESEYLHKYPIPMRKEETFPQDLEAKAKEMNFSAGVTYLMHLETQLIECIFKNNTYIIDDLSTYQFDLVWTGVSGAEVIFANVLNLTFVRYFPNLQEPIISNFFAFPSKASVWYPVVMIQSVARNFEPGSFMIRLYGQLFSWAFAFMTPSSRYHAFMEERFYYGVETFNNGVLLGSGFEGMFDAEQWPPFIGAMFPLTLLSSKSNADLSLTAEYQDFLSTFDNNILISFGTTYKPTNATLLKLAQLVKATPSIGYIWSMKKINTEFETIKDMGLLNLKLEPFVPQKALLNHSKVAVLITHCGANSLLESIYYGKPILGFPIDVDQFSNCKRMEMIKTGYHTDKSSTVQELKTIVESFVQQGENHEVVKSTKKYQRLFEFMEERSSKNVTYWINHVKKFGVKHLQNPQHNLGLVELYDLDILGIFCMPVLATLLIMYSFCCQRKRTSKVKQE